MQQGRAKLICHHCGRPHRSAHGGDLTCSAECRQRFENARTVAEQQLAQSDFKQHAEIPNLWEKGGVHISIDQVIREGFEQTLALHAAAAAENR